MDDEDLLTGGAAPPVDEMDGDLEAALRDAMAAMPPPRPRTPPAEDEHRDDDDVAASSHAGDVPLLPDGRPVTSLSKKEAKAQLDSGAYKAWKRATKGAAPTKEKKSRKDKKKEKKKEKKKRKDNKKASKRGRGSDNDSDDGEYQGEEEEETNREDLASHRKSRRERNTEKMRALISADDERRGRGRRDRSTVAAVAPGAQPKMSRAARAQLISSKATAIVDLMRQAQRLDKESLRTKASPPIHRIRIRDRVVAFARVSEHERALVENGFLEQIAEWILDTDTEELATLDLRNAAFELLLRYGFVGSMDITHPNRQIDREDLDAWEGIGREHLSESYLGRAVSVARQHIHETPHNKGQAVTLLERMSRAWSGGSGCADDASEKRARGRSGGGVGSQFVTRWPSMDDPTIETPFTHVTTATEAFRKKIQCVDPHDPTSYLRVPPLYLRKTPIL